MGRGQRSEDGGLELSSAACPSQLLADGGAFRFTGNGYEYFRIWIVDSLLTVLTLGIYSAWAKLHTMQYFYRHTELAGSRFDYRAAPGPILAGRVFVASALAVVVLAFGLSVLAGLVALAISVLLLPWFLHHLLCFNLEHSSYRGLRFSFHGSLGRAYAIFFVLGGLAVLSCGLGVPLFHQQLHSYLRGNILYGSEPASLRAGLRQFYWRYAVAISVLLLGVTASFLLLGEVFRMSHAVLGGSWLRFFFFNMVAVGVLLVLALVVARPLLTALIANLLWNGSRLGEYRFESRIRPLNLMWISASNAVLTLLSFGVFMPWAAMRVARYRAACLRAQRSDAEPVFAESLQDGCLLPLQAGLIDGGHSEVSEQAGPGGLTALPRYPGSPVPRAWHQGWAALLSVALLLLIAVAGYRWLLPVVAEQVAARVPGEFVETLADITLWNLDLDRSRLQTERQLALARGFAQLRKPPALLNEGQLLFRSGEQFVGARALADGRIVVDDRMAMLVDDQQMMAVLAHEYGHGQLRHAMQWYVRSAAIGAATLWWTAGFSSVLVVAPVWLAGQSYSRDAELQADDYAAALLEANGIPPARLVEVLQKLPPDGNISSVWRYLMSHPSIEERSLRLRRESQ